MNNITSGTLAKRLTIGSGAIALLAIFTFSAFAMPPSGDHSSARFEHGLKAISRLHDSLKLDAKQETLWKEAEQASKDKRADRRDQFRKQHEEIKAMLDKPGTDLHAVVKRMDELRDAGQKQHLADRALWFTVYDSLNAEQKEQARQFFLKGFDRQSRRGDPDGRKGSK